MAGGALRPATKQHPSGLLLRSQHFLIGVRESVIEFRGEWADLRRSFIRRNGEGKLIVRRIRATAIRRAQMNWERVIARRRPRCVAHLIDIIWPANLKGLLAPDKFEEPSVGTLRNPAHDARRIW